MKDLDSAAPIAVAARLRLPREERRGQLLDVAAETFSARGFHNTVMEDVAEAAGVSKPVLYQHFNSKRSLYLALLDELCVQLVQLITAEMSTTDRNADRIASAIDAFYRYVSDSNKAYRLLFESDLANEPVVSDRIWQMYQELATQIGAVIASDTGLNEEEAKFLGVSLVGQAQVSARYWKAGETHLGRDRAVELVSTLAWRGMRGYPRHKEIHDTEH